MSDSAASGAKTASALALTSDLLLHSQLSAAAESAGVDVLLAASIDVLLANVANGQPRLLILDLGHPGLDPAELVPRLKTLAPHATIVAFGPHVHRQRLAAAAEAGCDLVISRGQFHAQMPEILERYAGE